MISVEIDNASIKGLLRDLKGYERESLKAISKATDQTSAAIQMDAINRLRGMFGSAPHSIPKPKKGAKKLSNMEQTGHGWGGLAGSIYNKAISVIERNVGTNKPYAAYIEFGTGEKVFTNFSFDDAAKKVAALFKGTKRVKGIRGDSFLNWAAVNQEKKHIERIETELNKINK